MQPARPADQPVVAAQRLTKIFKDFWMRQKVRAVEDLDLEIYPREVFGLLGPNGSGKSTTIKMILGLFHRTSGRLAVFGKSPDDVSIKKRIGFLPEESYLYPFLNARETLDLYGKLFNIDYKMRKRRIDELLDMVGLAHAQHRQMHEYSKGMQRRIGIAQALINDPDFLILDEPTTGLDPLGTRQIKDLIVELGRRGKTVLLSSHLLADVEDCVDRLAILYGGRKRAEGTCDELLVASDRTMIETVRLSDRAIQRIDAVLREEGAGEARVAQPRQRLEEVFLQIVEQARAERLETGGAREAGPTAAFLRGEDEGAALIDQLLSEEGLTPMPVEEKAAKQQREQEHEPQEDLVEQLLDAGEAEQAPPPQRPAEPARPAGEQAEPTEAPSKAPGSPESETPPVQEEQPAPALPKQEASRRKPEPPADEEVVEETPIDVDRGVIDSLLKDEDEDQRR
jgi:ABC-2 type transport system ATP-binding protein